MPRKSYPGITKDPEAKDLYHHKETGATIRKAYSRGWMVKHDGIEKRFGSLGAAHAALEGLRGAGELAALVEPVEKKSEYVGVRLSNSEKAIAEQAGKGDISAGIRKALAIMGAAMDATRD